jgi:hypothetical protein
VNVIITFGTTLNLTRFIKSFYKTSMKGCGGVAVVRFSGEEDPDKEKEQNSEPDFSRCLFGKKD